MTVVSDGFFRRWVLLLALCGWGTLSFGQEDAIKARAEAVYLPPYRIGDVIRYKVTVIAPEQVQVRMPNPPSLAPFEVLGGGKVRKQRGELPGIVFTSAEWDIAVYRLGTVTIPSLSVPCETEGRRILVRTNPITIEVVPPHLAQRHSASPFKTALALSPQSDRFDAIGCCDHDSAGIDLVSGMGHGANGEIGMGRSAKSCGETALARSPFSLAND